MGTKRFKVQKTVSELVHQNDSMNEPNDSKKDLFILINKFKKESHKRSSL